MTETRYEGARPAQGGNTTKVGVPLPEGSVVAIRRRDVLGEVVADYEAEHGGIPAEARAKARAVWADAEARRAAWDAERSA